MEEILDRLHIECIEKHDHAQAMYNSVVDYDEELAQEYQGQMTAYTHMKIMIMKARRELGI